MDNRPAQLPDIEQVKQFDPQRSENMFVTATGTLFDTSILYDANKSELADVCVNQGGTSSGKTYAILQVLFALCIEEAGIICTVVGQDIPNLKGGALRDAKTIVANSPALQARIKQYNETERTWTFISGSILEFKSYKDEQDARSGKRDYLFINECNGISFEVFDALHTRTKNKTFLDYNPSHEFWVHTRVLNNPEYKSRQFISNHWHNPFCPEKLRQKIEARKYDKDWYDVYGRGLTGKIEGLVFRNWHVVDDLPRDDKGEVTAKFIARGMDFGFTNDPTAIIAVYMQNGELYLDEECYEVGLTNPLISDKLDKIGVKRNQEVIADCAEPKSIKELQDLKKWITPSAKGQDSIRNGIDILKRYTINVTARSVNLRKELAAYRWKTKNGLTDNKPVEFMNHAIDAVRYVALNKLSTSRKGKYSIQ